jgi:hypothetical protein
MAGDADGPGGHSGGYIHDGADQVQTKDQPQPAHWVTLSSGLTEPEVRSRIRRALAARSPHEMVLGGSESLRGVFVVRFKSGKHVRMAEVTLSPWEGGTQVHLALPDEFKAEELARLGEWLRPYVRGDKKAC